jgi:hypothetical protein
MDNFISECKKMTNQDLELIFNSEPMPKAEKPNFLLWLSKVLKLLTETLTESNQPKIRLSKNKVGEVHWIVNDPITGRKAILYSEEEVRTWLEQLYY